MRAAGHEKKAAAGREKLRAADPEEGGVAAPGAGEDNFFARVYEAVRRIPCGRVATYGQIARLCGNARASRATDGTPSAAKRSRWTAGPPKANAGASLPSRLTTR